MAVYPGMANPAVGGGCSAVVLGECAASRRCWLRLSWYRNPVVPGGSVGLLAGSASS